MLARLYVIALLLMFDSSLSMLGVAEELTSSIELDIAMSSSPAIAQIAEFKQPRLPAGFIYYDNLVVGEIAEITLRLNIVEPSMVGKKPRLS